MKSELPCLSRSHDTWSHQVLLCYALVNDVVIQRSGVSWHGRNFSPQMPQETSDMIVPSQPSGSTGKSKRTFLNFHSKHNWIS